MSPNNSSSRVELQDELNSKLAAESTLENRQEDVRFFELDEDDEEVHQPKRVTRSF